MAEFYSFNYCRYGYKVNIKTNLEALLAEIDNKLESAKDDKNEIIDQIKTEPKLLEISENPEYKEIFEKLIIKIIKEVSFYKVQ